MNKEWNSGQVDSQYFWWKITECECPGDETAIKSHNRPNWGHTWSRWLLPLPVIFRLCLRDVASSSLLDLLQSSMGPAEADPISNSDKPTVLKDLIFKRGIRTTSGFPIYRWILVLAPCHDLVHRAHDKMFLCWHRPYESIETEDPYLHMPLALRANGVPSMNKVCPR